MKFQLSRVSTNRKTGPIPVSTTSRESCPSTCALLGAGCYAENFPLGSHWDRVGRIGMSSGEFLKRIRQLPKGQLWRHNQAGDLPHTDGNIDEGFLHALVVANRRKDGFTYTHHLMNDHNRTMVQRSNDEGFTINVSADNVTQAVDLFKSGLPTVAVLPKNAPNEQICSGVKVVACPAEKTDRIQCSNCALCQIPDRGYIIGFRAHGTKAKKVDLIARST